MIKQSILLTIVSCICIHAFSQKTFEGKIVYSFTSLDVKNNGTLEAYFGKQKIKAILKEKGKKHKEDLLMDFNSGLLYFLNTRNKTYYTDSLGRSKQTKNDMPPVHITSEKNKAISGYQCTAYSGSDTTRSDFMGPLYLTIWYADSLYFPFNKNYADASMVPIFGDGNTVGMGLEVTFGRDRSSEKMVTSITSIEEKQFPDSLFVIPADYVTEKNYKEYTDSIFADSVTITPINSDSIAHNTEMVKEAMEAAKKMTGKAKEGAEVNNRKSKKSTHKKSPAKNTHTQPTKSSAIKPKQ